MSVVAWASCPCSTATSRQKAARTGSPCYEDALPNKTTAEGSHPTREKHNE